MDFEFAEDAFSPKTSSFLLRQRNIDKDEAVLARSGKSQQLRVSIVV